MLEECTATSMLPSQSLGCIYIEHNLAAVTAQGVNELGRGNKVVVLGGYCDAGAKKEVFWFVIGDYFLFLCFFRVSRAIIAEKVVILQTRTKR